jgi:GT2 family glycosyltransferase
MTSGGLSGSVSAVVINFNGGAKLRDSVLSLCSQTVTLQSIVVVDNGSTDTSVDSIDNIDPRVTTLELGENLGLTRARNAGMRAVESEFILLCDNDICLAPGALAHLLNTAKTEHAAVVCPRIVYHPDRDTIQTDGAKNHYLGIMSMRRPDTPVVGSISEVTAVNSAIGACYLLNRKQIIDCGGFNELYFFYFEDLEFALRIRSRDLQMIFDSNAVVFHNRGAGTPGLSFRGAGSYPRLRAELSMRNRLLTIALHFQTRTLFVMSPALVVYECTNFAYCLLRGWTSDWFRSWHWITRHRHEIIKRRRKLNQVRKIGDRQLLSGGPIPFSKGFLSSSVQRFLANALSGVLNAYWLLARHLLRD